MLRGLFTLLSALSLLLCVAVVVLWVRSYFVRDAVEFGPAGVAYELRSNRGLLRVGNQHLVERWNEQFAAYVREGESVGPKMTELNARMMALNARMRSGPLSPEEQADWKDVQAEMARLGQGMARRAVPPPPRKAGFVVPTPSRCWRRRRCRARGGSADTGRTASPGGSRSSRLR